ncbi:hypothetical protein J7X11_002292 [Vibrio parahaemolyticus]|nr:hypothetical protein [Vibrio parahaemolyticus]
MQLAVLVCALSLVLVGLLFGFNIQVSDSVVAVLNSMGSILGGVGAAVAAFISYRSIGLWREQFVHSKTYEAFSVLEEIIPQIFEGFMQKAYDQDLRQADFFRPIKEILTATTPNEEKSYNNAILSLYQLLPRDQRTSLNTLALASIQQKLLQAYFTISDSSSSISEFLKNNPEVAKSSSLSEITEISEYLNKRKCAEQEVISFFMDSLTLIRTLKSNL